MVTEKVFRGNTIRPMREWNRPVKLVVGAGMLVGLLQLTGMFDLARQKYSEYKLQKYQENIKQPDELKGGEPIESLPVSYINYNLERPVTKSDAERLAEVIYGEGSICSNIERTAIGYTAVNFLRSKEGKGMTLEEELTPGRYNGLRNPIDKQSKAWADCMNLAEGILERRISDPTNGATHFILNGTSAYWTSDYQKVGRIQTGNGPSKHVFYKPRSK